MPREPLDNQFENRCLIPRNAARNTKLAIFVHGFRGGYLSTWGQLGDYLKNHADNDPVLMEWDYLFIGYNTRSIDSFLSIAKLISTYWSEAAAGRAPFSSTYTKFALFGHSLGTLGIRQLLCAFSQQPAGMTTALHCVALFGSPLNGSPLGWMGGLAGYKIGSDLNTGSSPLEMLHEWNETTHALSYQPNIPVKVVLGTDDAVAGMGGIASWRGDLKMATAFDHTQMTKVDLATGANTFIVNFLKNEL